MKIPQNEIPQMPQCGCKDPVCHAANATADEILRMLYTRPLEDDYTRLVTASGVVARLAIQLHLEPLDLVKVIASQMKDIFASLLACQLAERLDNVIEIRRRKQS